MPVVSYLGIAAVSILQVRVDTVTVAIATDQSNEGACWNNVA